MKFVYTVVRLLPVVAFIGITLCSDIGNEILQGGETSCRVQIETHQDMSYVLLDYTAICFIDNFLDLARGLKRSSSRHELGNTFKTFCENLPTENSCSANVTSTFGNCLNATQTTNLKLHLVNLQTILRVGCQQDGGQLVTFVEERRRLNKSETFSFSEPCYKRFHSHLDAMYMGKLPQWDVETYRMIKAFRECIAGEREGEGVLKNVTLGLMDDVMKKLKCILPVNKMEVFCETFVLN